MSAGKAGSEARPVDQKARKAAATELDTTFFVEAGAGTGKTTALIARIVSIVTSKRARVHEVVAITFTEKAAGELKMRLREELERSTTGQLRSEALADLERAHITTIHSFCAWVLRERPVEAAVDPQFAVADELQAQLLFDDAWEEWFEGQLAENPPALQRAILREFNLDSLRSLAALLHERREPLSRAQWPEPKPCALEPWLAKLQDAAPVLARCLEHCTGKTENYYRQVMALVNLLERTGDMSEDRLVAALCELELTQPKRIADFDTPDNFRRFKAAVQSVQPPMEEFAEAAGHNLLLELAAWLGGFVAHLERCKHQGALLDFDDLLSKTRDLLRDNGEVRRELQGRFRFILVDEFQDTDPLQAEIVLLLDEGRPGKLFLVGDPKQSIYRFRGADIELYAATRRAIEKRGRVLQLKQNFRSASTILDWVNAVFSKLITAPGDGDYQPDYTPLEAAPHLTTKEPRVTLLKPDTLEKKSADETRRDEAAAIARYLAAEQGAGRLRWAEAVMLFRSFTGLAWYTDALVAQGIPFRVVGGRGYYQRQEIETLVALLYCLDNPADHLHLVAVLRSPLFGWTDEQVFVAMQTTGLDYTAAPDDGTALGLLRELHRAQRGFSVAGFVEHVLARAQVCEAFLATQPDGAQCVANLLKALNLARQMEAAGLRSLRSFVRHLRDTVVSGIDEEPSPANEETDDVVRILTTHKSKGLEFPMVILPDLGGVSSDSDDRLLFPSGHNCVELRFQGRRTCGFDQWKEKEKVREQAEEKRLLYVASTRAEKRLILPWFAEKGERLGYLLQGFVPKKSELVEVVDAGSLPGDRREPPKKDPARRALEELMKERQTWMTEREALLARASRPAIRLSPSKLAGEIESDGEPVGGSVRERAMEFGVVVHETLERMSVEGIDHSGLDPAEKVRATQVVERALRSDLFARVRRAEQVYRELPFALMTDNGLMEGIIDLLFCENGKWVLVDYKTDARVEADRYVEQIRAYESALKQLAGITLAEKLLFFLVPGVVQPVDE